MLHLGAGRINEEFDPTAEPHVHVLRSVDRLTDTMPKQVHDIKQFIELCRRKDAKAARIKKSTKGSSQVKFKVRCHRHLYTLVLKDTDKAEKLKQSLPPGLDITDVPAGKK
ncbi:hypothetical protein EX30DRAFT_342406 [Ascodesmis nigricans]|uniref:Ribosomal protein L38e n=1 Tax=Ascodesmis nigricans TaxID=341454 RepID=A0A4S2MQ18_9PEZI|nr:hypothetical protein EX30DRAFT_342406 [Ascodesmis nigricans]